MPMKLKMILKMVKMKYKNILINIIRFYRKNISPLKNPCCRYVPTCSQYAIEAVEKYGAFKGGLMAAWRILRCNPLSKGGYDPVK